MSPKELGSVKSAGDAFAEIATTMPNGTKDPICVLDEGIGPENADDSSLFFVARDAEPFRSRLATLAIENPETDDAQLMLFASDRLAEKPRLMRTIVESVLQEAEVEEVMIDQQEGTNVSGAVLQKIGAVALEGSQYVLKVAA